MELAFTVNGEKTNENFPPKTSGYQVNNVTCENGVTAEWNIENWGLVNINSNGSTKIKCSIDFKSGTSLIEYLKNLNSEELVEDEYGNLRYIGANPNNYVSFNNELWRIIGVMKDIENPDGSKESKVKLIRNESIGQYLWDNKPKGTESSISEYGSNDWSDSALQKVLNEGAYYNRTNGDCPYGVNGATRTCDFTNNGLTEEAKSMISESVWNLGGYNNFNDGTTKKYYEAERGSMVYSGRPIKWSGNVGLIYLSDYGYATSGGSNRNYCLNSSLANWDESTLSDCINNDWLIKTSVQWTLTPYSSGSYSIFVISGAGYGDAGISKVSGGGWPYIVHPVVYLNLNIKIEGENDGTSTSPFVLKAN